MKERETTSNHNNGGNGNTSTTSSRASKAKSNAFKVPSDIFIVTQSKEDVEKQQKLLDQIMKEETTVQPKF